MKDLKDWEYKELIDYLVGESILRIGQGQAFKTVIFNVIHMTNMWTVEIQKKLQKKENEQKITREEAINSPAYKMLNSMIEDKVDELKSWMHNLDLRYNQAKNPSYHHKNYKTDLMEETFYTPKLHIGTSFDEVKEIEISHEIRGLKTLAESIKEIVKLKEDIEYLNSEKLYLIQADYDWNDEGRRSKRVFGIKTIS